MAKRVIHEIIDDLDGSEAAETVVFGLDGMRYEIDLSGGNATELRGALAKYIGAGQRTGRMVTAATAGRNGTTSRPGGSEGRVSREQNDAIRSWAKSQGIDVSDRGRIPREIVDKFNEAHKP